MTEDDDRVVALPGLVPGETAPECGFHTKHGEEVASDPSHAKQFRLSVPDVGRLSAKIVIHREVLERRHLLPPIEHVGRGRLGVRPPELGVGLEKHDQTVYADPLSSSITLADTGYPIGMVLDPASDHWFIDQGIFPHPSTPFAGYDELKYYAPDAVIERVDHERSTFKTVYKNNTGLEIPPHPFDPTEWNRENSEQETPWGHTFAQTGLISGGKIEKTGPTSVSISAGYGVFLDKTNGMAIGNTTHSWATAIDVQLPNIAVDLFYFLFIDALGTVTPVVNLPSSSFYRLQIFLGFVGVDPTAPTEVGNIISAPYTAQNEVETIADVNRMFIKPSVITGGVLSGNAAANLTFDVSAARVFGYNINFHVDKNSPNEVVAPAAVSAGHDIVIDGVPTGTLVNDINVVEWDDGGTVTNVKPSETTITLVYYSYALNRFYTILPQTVYSSLSEAINQIPNYGAAVVLPDFVNYGTIFIGYICTEAATTDLTDPTNSHIRTAAGASITGAGSSIEELDGLTDVTLSDRKQYHHLRYNATGGVWENKENDLLTIWRPAVGHTFAEDKMVYIDSAGAVQLAQADALPTTAFGIIVDTQIDEVCISFRGVHVSIAHGLGAAGATLYLSATTAGELTPVPPIGQGNLVQKCLRVIDADTYEIRILGASPITLDPLADSVIDYINQIGHGFALGQQIYFDNALWQLAQADNVATAKTGVVTGIRGVDDFTLTYYGAASWAGHALTVGVDYYLSTTVAGGLQTAVPTLLNEIGQKALKATGTDTVFVYDDSYVQNSLEI